MFSINGFALPRASRLPVGTNTLNYYIEISYEIHAERFNAAVPNFLSPRTPN